jgi:glycosyltransferase involved in cell wall biosynthesis
MTTLPEMANAPTHSAQSLTFTFVIPTYNEAANIGRCLESIAALDYPSSAFDVIVVDNGSADSTVSIAQGFADRLRLQVLTLPKVRIAALRNFGAKHAIGEFLVFMDADCTCKPDALAVAARIFAARRDSVLGSEYLVPESFSWIAKDFFQPRKDLASLSFIPAGNMLIARDEFQKLGGFDESIQTNEDCELCLRARRAGLTMTPTLDLGFLHWGTPQTLGVFYRKTRWHGTHVLKVFLRNLSDRQNLKPLAYAALSLLFILGMIAGLIYGALRGDWRLASASAAAWLAVALLLAMMKAAQESRWTRILPLWILYVVYGAARAESLLRSPFNWHRK